jgi:hypothetical protein
MASTRALMKVTRCALCPACDADSSESPVAGSLAREPTAAPLRLGTVSPARIKVCRSEVTLTVLYLKALIALANTLTIADEAWFDLGISARL